MKAKKKRLWQGTDKTGYEGAVMTTAEVRISQQRISRRPIRCQPGTFEWRYGRKTADSTLYDAGVKFAALWEIAGIASASSPDWKSAGGGDWKGLPDGRLIAMQAIDSARRDIGRWSTARLVDYCVMGTTVRDMADKYEADQRQMAHVLDMDLRSCADHFLTKR